MKYGADPNVIPTDETGATTMIRAARAGNIDSIKTLLNINNEYKYSFDWVCFFYVHADRFLVYVV